MQNVPLHLQRRQNPKGQKSKMNITQQFNCQTYNIVHVIHCTKCAKLYIGETGRTLDIRFKKTPGWQNTTGTSRSRTISARLDTPSTTSVWKDCGFCSRTIPVAGKIWNITWLTSLAAGDQAEWRKNFFFFFALLCFPYAPPPLPIALLFTLKTHFTK